MLTRTLNLYKTSFTGLSANTWINSGALLVNRSGTMVVAFFTLYLTDKSMGFTLSQAGFAMALFGMGSVAGAYAGGWLTDRIGFYKVQLFSLFSGGLLFIVLAYIKTFELICGVTFILALFNEAFRPANSSATTYYSDASNITRSFSLNRLAVNLGWAVGASLGGFLASYNYKLLFWVDGLTNISAAVLIYIYLKPSNGAAAVKSKDEEMPVKNSAYRDKAYLWFVFLVALFCMGFFQLFTTVPKYFRDNLHLSESFIGLVMALNGLIIALIEMVIIYRFEGKKEKTEFIFIGSVICGLAFLSLLLPGNHQLVVLFMIVSITLGEIISMPFFNSFAMERSSQNNRGQYAALLTMAWSIGQIAGPSLFSLVAERWSFETMFVEVAILFIVTGFGFRWIGRFGRIA